MTWPAHLNQVPDITDYTMSGRTYRYFNGEPLYPFGYGLSYTKFEYKDLKALPSTLLEGESFIVKVTVKNTGLYGADEVIQLYISWPVNSTVPTPKLQMVGFTRERIRKGQEITVKFTVKSEQLAVWMDDYLGWGVIPGKMMLYAGGQQPNQTTYASSNVLATPLTMLPP